MAFGLQTVNSSGQLTLSDSGFTYGYIGRAGLVAVGAASGSVTSKVRGSSTYTITWAGDIIVALPVKVGCLTRLLSMTRSGDTWTIVVYNGNNTRDADGFDNQVATEVYVFGLPVWVAGFGAALYNASGVLCADLTRRPLTYAGRMSLDAGALESAMPAAAVPAIIGSPHDYITSSSRSGAFYFQRISSRAWGRDPYSGNLYRGLYLERLFRDDGPGPVNSTTPEAKALIIDAGPLT